MTSVPEGSFNYDESDKTGEWSIQSITNPSDTQIKLQGSIRLNDSSLNELPGNIVAIVNLRIKEYSFSGSVIEKVSCNLTGGSTSKDDSSVFKGIKITSHAKNIEYRF